MTGLDTLVLHTVQTNRYSEISDDSPSGGLQGYVVGVEHDDGDLWLADVDTLHFNSERDGLIKTSIEVPVWFATRFAKFYQECQTRPQHERIPYNCHSFARGIQGYSFPAIPTNMPVEVIRDGEITDAPLDVGQVGVFGRPVQTSTGKLGYHAAHSIVGLGKNNPNCIQVTSQDGLLAIAPLANVISKYKAYRGIKSRDSGIRLYVMPQSQTSV